MPFRFRKSLKIAPGVRLNLSKGGISTSLGGRGHSLNVGKSSVKSTVGIPGTGLSYTAKAGGGQTRKNSGCGLLAGALVLGLIVLACGSTATAVPAPVGIDTVIAATARALAEVPTSAPPPAQAPAATEAPSPAPAAPPPLAQVGQMIEEQGYHFTVTNVETAASYGIYDADAGKQLLAVEVLVESSADSGVDVNPFYFSVQEFRRLRIHDLGLWKGSEPAIAERLAGRGEDARLGHVRGPDQRTRACAEVRAAIFRRWRPLPGRSRTLGIRHSFDSRDVPRENRMHEIIKAAADEVPWLPIASQRDVRKGPHQMRVLQLGNEGAIGHVKLGDDVSRVQNRYPGPSSRPVRSHCHPAGPQDDGSAPRQSRWEGRD